MTQRTLKRRIELAGAGLHTGRKIRIQILPAPADSGIRFVRTDLHGACILLDPLRVPSCAAPSSEGEARPHPPGSPVSRADHATTLSGDGFSISTVEHLMAALQGLGVANATVRVSGDEVPIMDGSAAPFAYLIKEAGVRDLGVPRRLIRITRPVGVLDGDREVTVYPADRFRVSYTIDFAHPAIGRQSFSCIVNERLFIDEIAPARTFCLLRDVQALRKRGLALGGSLGNAVVVGDRGPLNTLRFDDEFVRHKALDLVGDLALLGHPVLGHVVGHKAGHAMHARLLQALLQSPDAWTLTTGEPALVAAGAAPPIRPVAVGGAASI